MSNLAQKRNYDSFVIAKYIRLSVDDTVTESLSIPNQRRILDSHIDGLDIPNAEILEMVDNGHSGTTMERPAVQELLELVRCKKVDLIIIKDFSRFSRNSLESGYYLEQVFPLYGVRLISVNDNFDSKDYKNDTGGIDVAFKFLMHEYYVQDLSKKVKSAKRIQMKKGENIVARAIYGYHKVVSESEVSRSTKKSKGRWEPDEPAANVVRQIFQMALAGLSTAEIRDRLSTAKYPTPREYLELKHGFSWGADVPRGFAETEYTESDFQKMKESKCLWTARMVLNILNNEQYTGSYIAGKQNSKAIGSSSKDWVAKKDWIVIPDSHTPIVSKEDFAKVQELYQNIITPTTRTKPVDALKRNAENTANRNSKCGRIMNGELKKGLAAYGYWANENSDWEVDEEAATIVVKIFELAQSGFSAREISKQLTAASYSTPKEHYHLKRGKNIKPTCSWRAKSVRDILSNQQYTGTYIAGKILKNHETGKKYHTPSSEWVVIPNRHPAIISKEVFDNVQETITANKAKGKNKCTRTYLLQGNIVKCGCCGYALAYDDSLRNESYRCHRTYSDANAECHKMNVNADELHSAVMEIIKKQSELLLRADNISSLKKVTADNLKTSQYEEQHSELTLERQKYYEQFVSGEITKEEFLKIKSELAEKVDEINRHIANVKQSELAVQAVQKTTSTAKTVLSESITDREIVEMLIDKIHVFPNHQIEITWKIEDFAGSLK